MKNGIIAIVILAILIVGGYFVFHKSSKPTNSSTQSSNSTKQMNMPSSSSSSNKNATQTNAVTIQNFSFSPDTIKVSKGTKVTWTNGDSTQHTVTADSSGGFDSGTLDPGKTYSFTFNTVGTFAYHCNFHSSMHGTVIVQ